MTLGYVINLFFVACNLPVYGRKQLTKLCYSQKLSKEIYQNGGISQAIQE